MVTKKNVEHCWTTNLSWSLKSGSTKVMFSQPDHTHLHGGVVRRLQRSLVSWSQIWQEFTSIHKYTVFTVFKGKSRSGSSCLFHLSSSGRLEVVDFLKARLCQNTTRTDLHITSFQVLTNRRLHPTSSTNPIINIGHLFSRTFSPEVNKAIPTLDQQQGLTLHWHFFHIPQNV